MSRDTEIAKFQILLEDYYDISKEPDADPHEMAYDLMQELEQFE